MFPLHAKHDGKEPQAPKWKPGDRARRADTGQEVMVTSRPRRHDPAVWDTLAGHATRQVQWIVSVQPDAGLADNISTDHLVAVD